MNSNSIELQSAQSNKPNDQAQLRASQSENNTEDESGALAAAPCSALSLKRYHFDSYDGRLLYEENGRRQEAEESISKAVKFRMWVRAILNQLNNKLTRSLEHKLSQKFGISFGR